jgi:hypothetical protein
MQAKVIQAFKENPASQHPYVVELFKKARSHAKKYEQTVQLEQSMKGKQLTEA